MRKIGLIISLAMVAMVFASFVYADINEVATPRNLDGGAANAWKKPEVVAAPEPLFEVVPPGIERRGDEIPGMGKHLGWNQGKHLGWDKVEIAEVEDVEVADIENGDAALPVTDIMEDEEEEEGKQRTKWRITREAGDSEKHGEVKDKGPIVSE